MPFAAHIIMKLTSAPQHRVEIFQTQLYANRSRKVDSLGRNSFTPSRRSMTVIHSTLTKFTIAQKIFVNNSYIKFGENLKNRLVANTRLETDR